MTGWVTHLACARCGEKHDHRVPQSRCPCGGPLLVEYDLAGIAAAVTKEDIAARAPTMWRYAELLPVDDDANVVSLGEGFTPLLQIDDTRYLKDESRNPTGTFKARGASCGISRMRELDLKAAALSTAGNAGSAWACYATASGIPVRVTMPIDAPSINKMEARAYGAHVDVADIADFVAGDGWFDVSTMNEPYRIEGKKTLGLEIAEQLDYAMPDALFLPTGGGVGLIGVWRALTQLQDMGWITDPLPRLIAVQARGCAPIVQAFEDERDDVQAWENPHTIAAGLNVPKPLGGRLVLEILRASGGTAVDVSDEQIRYAMHVMARDTGILASPEGAATWAAERLLRHRAWLRRGETAVLVNTGTGLKHADLLAELH